MELKKAARGHLDDYEKKHYTKKDIIRTDFILENIYSYLLRNHHEFQAISAMHENEIKVLNSIKDILDDLLQMYGNRIKNLCLEIPVIQEDKVYYILQKISSEVFIKDEFGHYADITWSNIISFFAFVGEFAVSCCKDLNRSILDTIYEAFYVIVNTELQCWIEDHDGWQGLQAHYQKRC